MVRTPVFLFIRAKGIIISQNNNLEYDLKNETHIYYTSLLYSLLKAKQMSMTE